MKFFEEGDVLKQLANRMGDYADFEDFHPLDNDYAVLEWMRNDVRLKYPTTYNDFISYISGAMHCYQIGDYVKAALFAIGITNTSKE
jgi:hypothetical protein